MEKLETKLENKESITVKGLEIHSSNPWSAYHIASGVVLLSSPESSFDTKNPPTGLSWVSPKIFFQILSSLNKSKWTGVISSKDKNGICKSIYLVYGQLVFAESNSMNDSLGEVLYRHNLISLEKLTKTAARVKRGVRFGDTLINDNVMNFEQIWEALKIQTINIMDSLFRQEMVYFEIYNDIRSKTELCFIQDTNDIFFNSYCFSISYKEFVGLLSGDERVIIHDLSQVQEKFPPETFLGDLILMIQSSEKIDTLLKKSKLPQDYTISSIILLLIQDAISLDGYSIKLKAYRQRLPLSINQKYDLYNSLLRLVTEEFNKSKIELPILLLKKNISQYLKRKQLCITLDNSGKLTDWSLYFMSIKCSFDSNSVHQYEYIFNVSIQFLLMIANQYLDKKVVAIIKSDYLNK